MRRYLILAFAVLFALVPFAAADATDTTLLVAAPIVVVFPLGVAGGVDKEASSRLAVLFATKIGEGNGVVVKPAPPGTERKDYRTVAESLKADYYVTGYVTPIGDEVSVVEQVVSVESGIVVFSNTAQVRTYNDAAGQGETLRVAILRHSARNLGAIIAPVTRATAEPTAQPSGGTSTKLGGLGGLLGKKKKASPTAAPSASAAPSTLANARPIDSPGPAVSEPPVITPVPRPSLAPPRTGPPPTAEPTAIPPTANPPTAAQPNARRFAIVAINGTADADARGYATDQIGALLARNGAAGESADATQSAMTTRASELCAAANATGIVTGTLALRTGDPQYGKTTIATFELAALDCTGKTVFRKAYEREAGGRNDVRGAIDLALEAGIGAYLHPPRGRAR